MNGSAKIERQSLPDGWRWVKLGDVVEQDKISLKPSDELCSRLPYLSLEHVEPGTGRINPLGKSKIASNTFIFDDRHVLYGKLRPYLNKVATPDFRGRCTTEIIPLLPKGTNREYLAHFLRLPETVEYAMSGKTGSRMPRTDMRAFMHLPVPLPPLAEQQRIVRFLDEKLAAIEKAKPMVEAQLEAAEALAFAFLSEVHPVFSVSRQSSNAVHDQVPPVSEQQFKTVGELATTVIPPIKVLKSRFQERGKYPIIDQSQNEIAGWNDDEHAVIRPDRPYVIFGDHTCAVKYIDKPFVQGADGVKILRTNDEILPKFLFWILRIKPIGKSGYKRHFSELKKLVIPVLSLQEQRRVVSCLDEQHEYVTKLTSRLETQLTTIEQLRGAHIRKALYEGLE